jgi:hypothetical protein
VNEPLDPYLRVSVAGGQVLILLGAEDDPSSVENCEAISCSTTGRGEPSPP